VDADRIDDLWSRREALTPEEEAELLEAVRRDPAAFRADERMEGLLQTAGRTKADAERFLRRFDARVAAEADGARFVQRMDSRVRRPAWHLPLAAAAVIALVVTILFSLRPPAVEKTAKRAPIPPPVPEAPTPAPPPRAPEKPKPPPSNPDDDFRKAIEESKKIPKPPDPPKTPEPLRPPEKPPEPPKPAPEKPAPTRALPPTVVETATAITFADGTRIDLRPGAVVRDIQDGERGKRVTLDKGEIRAVVAKQSVPMVFTTPHAEATVLGTTLRLSAGSGTRLEVEEGKVRLKSGAKAVDVVTGHFAVAAEGATLAARPARVRSGLLAHYQFAEGEGRTIRDVSGVGAPLDLRLAGEEEVDYRWSKPRGLTFIAGNLAKGTPAVDNLNARADPADKIIDACRATNEFTIELWIQPSDFDFVRRDVAGVPILAIENPEAGVNFSVMQGGSGTKRYSARSLIQGTEWVKPIGPVELRLTHLVCARSANGWATFYMNGVVVRASEKAPLGPARWAPKQGLILGNAIGGNNPWRGEFHGVAFYDRALTADDVVRNFRAGVE
jgi:hypothetical protein